MLTFIKTTLSTFLHWALSKVDSNSEHKRQQTIKLNRLLYNLLALKTWIEKEVFMDQQLNKLLSVYENEVAQHSASDAICLKEKRAWLLKQVKKSIRSMDNFSTIADNIDIILKELSEIDPVFAFKLTGMYNITEKMDMLKNYLKQATSEIDDGKDIGDFVFNDILRPQMMADIFVQIQRDIFEVAKMINAKTHKEVMELNQPSNPQIEQAHFREFITPVVNKLLKSAVQN